MSIASAMTEPRKRKKPGPKPKATKDDPGRVRVAQTLIRSSPEWKATVDRLADFDRASSVSELVDRALAHYARHVGFKEALPKR